CNHVKADRHLMELGWRLRHKPAPPTGLAWRIIGTGHRDPRWLPYLQPFGGDDALARIEHVGGGGEAVAVRPARAGA
ncbi:HNH endonuclease, partial [Streptomyces sp. CAI-78]|nr:HNH endonuclease [Streptomyces sp. CAI-78]